MFTLRSPCDMFRSRPRIRQRRSPNAKIISSPVPVVAIIGVGVDVFAVVGVGTTAATAATGTDSRRTCIARSLR